MLIGSVGVELSAYDGRRGQASDRDPRVGGALVGLVRRMLDAGALTTIKAGKVLGVKAKNVRSLIDTSAAGTA